MKKSFILFVDSLDVLDELTTEQKAELFDAIRDHNRGVEPKVSGLMKAVFTPFKNQFIRDQEAYDEFVAKQREKGLKSAESRKKKKKPRSTTVNNGQPNPTESTYNDTDKDNDNDTETKEKNNSKEMTLLNWVNQNCPRVCAMTSPLTVAECERLIEEFQWEALTETLSSMENFKELKKYVSANLTLRKWLKNYKHFNNETPTVHGYTKILDLLAKHPNVVADNWIGRFCFAGINPDDLQACQKWCIENEIGSGEARVMRDSVTTWLRRQGVIA